jgi:hypothetical protein
MADENSGHDGPPTIVEYRIFWRPPDSVSWPDRWEECTYWPRDRADAEATCERFSRNHHSPDSGWADRRDYAVVEVARRAVRVFPAPEKGEG